MEWTRFGPLLRGAGRRALLLDYDGTLAPFHEDRMQARPFPGVREALTRILRAGHTHLAIVTGRTVEAVGPLLDLDPLPEIWGIHGWQRRYADGRRVDFDPGPVVREGIRRALEPASETWGAQWPHQWERKPISVSFHFRGLPEAEHEEFRLRVEPRWRAIADEHGLGLHAFDFGMELRVPGRNKGTVVTTLLDESASVRGGSPAALAFLGDDFTDEDAFRETAARRPSPAGLRGAAFGEAATLGVLVRAEWRPTAAEVWLRPPADLIAFLEAWHTHAAQ
jgi:trehalose-phosphatase